MEPEGTSGARKHARRRDATRTTRSSRERWLANTSVESRLSLAQLAGQRIIYAYAGLTPPQLLLARIREGEAAGVIFFGPNISSPAQMRAVVG
jgi:hypothetical protein